MNITTASLKTSISQFLRRFHMLIFTIVVLGGLAVCMLQINSIISQTGDDTQVAPTNTPADFDQATITRIKQLHTANDSSQSSLNLSGGRISPFVD